MTETDLADWLPIADAALAIGVSTRTVERLAKASRVEQRLRPQAGSPPVAVYNPDDVARLASERRRSPAPFVVGAVPINRPFNGNGNGQDLTKTSAGGLVTSLAAHDSISQFFTLMCHILQSPPSPPVAESLSERPVLTLDEAVRASGWSRTYLLRKIHGGALKAEKDRGWKIRRKDLEQL